MALLSQFAVIILIETWEHYQVEASPSARLRFIEGCLKYILPTITVDSELDEIIVELEQIKDVQT